MSDPQIPISDHPTPLLRLIRQSLESWSQAGVGDCEPIPTVTLRRPPQITIQPSSPPRTTVRSNSAVSQPRSTRTPPQDVVHSQIHNRVSNIESVPQEMAKSKRLSTDSTSLPRKTPVRKVTTSLPSPEAIGVEWSRVLPPDDTLAAMPDRAAALSVIEECVKNCTRCSVLANSRTQTVFGVGNPSSSLIFMGEAPGADEDLQGVPFVGRAGRLLTDMIEKGMKIPRDQVYILNTLKCRPPGNRTPLPTEAIACREFLDAQLAVLRPEFICCLGAVAAQTLLGVSTPIGKMRGHWYTLGPSRVMCTWHPAYLLRNPSAKQQTWADLQMLMGAMGLM